MLYSTLVSNVGWEYGIEAFMERPSIQDMIITPVVGSLIGEGFYRAKRRLVDNDYCLFGSRVLGGMWMGNPARREAHARAHTCGAGLTLLPSSVPGYPGFTLVGYF